MQDSQIELYKELTDKLEEKDEVIKEASRIFLDINKNRHILKECNSEIDSINIRDISTPIVSYDASRLHEKQKSLTEELEKLEEEAIKLKEVKDSLDSSIDQIKSKLEFMRRPMEEVLKEKTIHLNNLSENVTVSVDPISSISSDKATALCVANKVAIDSIVEVFERNSIPSEFSKERLIKEKKLNEFEEEINEYIDKKNEEIDEQIQMIQGVFEKSEEEPETNQEEKEENKDKKEDKKVKEDTIIEEERKVTEVDSKPIINAEEEKKEESAIVSLSDLGVISNENPVASLSDLAFMISITASA